MHSLSFLALAGTAAAQIRGFNYGALYADNTARQQSDWEADFRAAQNLPGVGGFTSARLFTMIQGYTTNTVISALPAAKATNTSLLLGLWASAGDAAFQQELSALSSAIQQYGDDLQDLIVGISIGSEDLYRISPTGIENDSGPGNGPDGLVSYIQQARAVLKGTVWADKSIGHVDTWTAYVNGSNNAVIEAIDWLGVDAYPYYETTNDNTLDNAPNLFFEALSNTKGASQGKPVWVTETGWPVTGPTSGQSSSGTAPAETYWRNVACRIFGGDQSVNAWWYQLNDGADQEVSFKVIPADRGAPLYDLSCPAGSGTGSTSSSLSSSSSSSSASSASAAGTGTSAPSGTGSSSGSSSGSASSSSMGSSGSSVASSTGSAQSSTTSTPETGSPGDAGQNAGQQASSGSSDGAVGAATSSVASSGSQAASATTSAPAQQHTGAAMPRAVNAAAGLLFVGGAVMAAL